MVMSKYYHQIDRKIHCDIRSIVYESPLVCSCCRIVERARIHSPDIKNEKKEQRFEKINIHLIQDKRWRDKVTFNEQTNNHHVNVFGCNGNI